MAFTTILIIVIGALLLALGIILLRNASSKQAQSVPSQDGGASSDFLTQSEPTGSEQQYPAQSDQWEAQPADETITLGTVRPADAAIPDVTPEQDNPYDLNPALASDLVTGNAAAAQDRVDATPVTEPETEQDQNAKPVINPKHPRSSWAEFYALRYNKEDTTQLHAWPASIFDAVGRLYGGAKGKKSDVATDFISGNYKGHEINIGDVNGGTIIAIRRPQSSAVDVHFSISSDNPLGMEQLDGQLNNFYVFSNRPFDAARFIDDRVADSMYAMSHVVSDVAINENWVAALLITQLDITVWDAIIPHIIALSGAAYTLPVPQNDVLLDLESADPLAPRNIGGSGLDLSAHGSLRAVVEPAEVATNMRADIPRSTTPVDIPQRAQEAKLGEEEHFADTNLGTVQDSELPELGNETYVPNTQGPRVLRDEGASALFGSRPDDGTGQHGAHASASQTEPETITDSWGRAEADITDLPQTEATGVEEVVDVEVLPDDHSLDSQIPQPKPRKTDK